MTVGRISLVLVATAALAVVGILVPRRDDLSDPAVLASMSANDLRDAEVETLVRAAFRNAKKVLLNAEEDVVVEDRATLDALADNFFVGEDEIRPEYPHPGVAYTLVVFVEGPYRPNFVFSDNTHITIAPGRSAPIPGKFAVKIGELLGLAPAAKHPAGVDPS